MHFYTKQEKNIYTYEVKKNPFGPKAKSLVVALA